MRIILLLILSHLIIAPVFADTWSGPVKVSDAATLRVGERLVRLHGIAAPRPGDQCPLAAKTIPCGHVATTALMDLTAGADAICQTHGAPNAGGITPATCEAGGYDLSEGMIYTGWARPNNVATARYREVEAGARKRKRGLWRGEFPARVNKAAVSR